MNKTDIEWCYGPDGSQGFTWNPVTGCSPASPGCDNCYASRIANRFKGTAAFPDGFNVKLHPDRIDEPRKLKKPSRIFVCSMSDIFHPDIPDEFIERIFKVMRECPQHTFFVLTKRPERMLGWNLCICSNDSPAKMGQVPRYVSNWFAPNIWVGVSAENQEQASRRIPVLLDLEVANRFVSIEPMLGPVDLTVLPANCRGINRRIVFEDYVNAYTGQSFDPQTLTWGSIEFEHIDWVICGAESGPGKRPCKTEWVYNLKKQCQVANVPFFFKNYNDARDANCKFDGEWPCPHDREYPKSI